MEGLSSLKIAIGQMDVRAGHPHQNFDTLVRFVEQAKAQNADLIVFPEMCIGGYFLADKWYDDAFVDELCSFNDAIRELSDGIGIIFGNVGRESVGPAHLGKDGRRPRYNCAFFASDGAWVAREGQAPAGRYLKTLLPNYRMFDDDRYFTSSLEDAEYHPELSFYEHYATPFVFERDGRRIRIGLQICEDLWSSDYGFNLTHQQVADGVDLIINLSASPWTIRKDEGRDKRIREHHAREGALPPLLYVNAVGMQNNGKNVFTFDGGSTLYGSDATPRFRCRDDFEEDLQIICLGQDFLTPSSGRSHSKQLDALVTGLRRFDEQLFPFKPRWVIGLSGGIDSSLTCALLHRALGDPQRIVGYNLATRYNSDVTKANAYELAQSLGIELRNGAIDELVRSTRSVLHGYGYGDDEISGLAEENIQARLRGHLLSTFAQVEGGVIMNNGNKIEVALGYATLYGDAIGAVSPLGDLTKVQLFSLAHEVNELYGREVIPENLIPRETEDGYVWKTMPSAELREAQHDPMKWFYHDWLITQLVEYPAYRVESIMEAYLADRLQSSPVAKWVRFYGLDKPQDFIEDLEWVLRQMRNSVFKRIQAPPIFTLSRGSFGNDFRECQGAYDRSSRYEELKASILAME